MSLRVRVMRALAIALSPIVAIAIIQAFLTVNEAEQDRLDELLVASELTIDSIVQSRASARLVLDIFSADLANGECQYVYSIASRELKFISNVAFVTAEGDVVCSFPDATVAPHIMGNLPEWKQMPGKRFQVTPTFETRSDGRTHGLLHAHERAEGGTAIFYMGIDELVARAADRYEDSPYRIAIAGQKGAASAASPLDIIPEAWIRQVLARNEPQLFRLNVDGTAMDVAMRGAGTEGDEIYALVFARSDGFFSDLTLRPARTIGLPLLAFATALIAAWFTMDRFALRWFDRLGRVARVYGAGHYELPGTSGFEHAPTEFAELAQAMDDMSNGIARRDNALRAAVREVHHRVKNNLQIVRSFLRLQERSLDDPQALAALRAAQARIDALAYVHETLYQHERVATVEMRSFFVGLFDYLTLALGMEELGIRLETDIDAAKRDADDAIPLALLTLEAVTNAVKYAFPAEHGPYVDAVIEVSYKIGAEETVLMVRDNGSGTVSSVPDPETGGLGARLMTAFARQLGGQLSMSGAQGGGMTITLRLSDAQMSA